MSSKGPRTDPVDEFFLIAHGFHGERVKGASRARPNLGSGPG